MNRSIAIICRVLPLSVAVCTNLLAAVPTVINIEGHLTGYDNSSIQIDGVPYAIERGSQAARDLANVRRGDAVSLEISPRRSPRPAPTQHLTSEGHEVVHPATAATSTMVKVLHAPGVR